MNKKISIIFSIVALLIIAIIILIVNKNYNQTTNQINSDYGFSFSIPAGWHIWEGYSAALELMNKTDFADNLESGLSELSDQKINEYQKFMDNWDYESSEIIVFTNSNKVDYKNRSLADAGKILSTQIDSQETLEQNSIAMHISTKKIEKIEESVNDKTERRNIEIGNKDAVLGLNKTYNLVDYYIIMVPIDSNKNVASSLDFTGYIKKNKQINEIASFINSLNISKYSDK